MLARVLFEQQKGFFCFLYTFHPVDQSEKAGDDDEVDEDGEEGNESEDDVHEEVTWVLEIMGARGHDSGVYTCTVHTDLDDARADLILTVEGNSQPL